MLYHYYICHFRIFYFPLFHDPNVHCLNSVPVPPTKRYSALWTTSSLNFYKKYSCLHFAFLHQAGNLCIRCGSWIIASQRYFVVSWTHQPQEALSKISCYWKCILPHLPKCLKQLSLPVIQRSRNTISSSDIYSDILTSPIDWKVDFWQLPNTFKTDIVKKECILFGLYEF